MKTSTKGIKKAFELEFKCKKEKFDVMDLLAAGSPMYRKTIELLKLPSNEFNIVWYPEVYIFYANGHVYRVGVSLRNSRKRVLDHLEVGTSKNGHSIWYINKCDDKAMLLFNVKCKQDRHWLLVLEAFFEENLTL